MTTYEVTARRWKRGWELHIHSVGVTQSHGLKDAEVMARDYIATVLDVGPATFDVRVTPEVGAGMDAEIAQARRAVQEAEDAQKAAAAQSRKVVAKLIDAGLTGKDVATVLKISPQRVSQLARKASKPAGRSKRGARSKESG